LQRGGLSRDLYELFIAFSPTSSLFDSGVHEKQLQEPDVTHLYEELTNPLFEIYGFGYRMNWVSDSK
jgi:hypothetical protein